MKMRLHPGKHAITDTPLPSAKWVLMSEAERVAVITKKSMRCGWVHLDFIRASANGHVIVSLKDKLGPAKRGELLLKIEEELKREVDPGLTIWLQPQSDKSVLRKLRGVEIK